MYAYIRMKKHIHLLLMALVAMSLTTVSCMQDDDDEVVLSEQCYVSSFSLGSLKRSVYGKTSAGEDSIYTTSFSGATFTMVIDQRRLTIENPDSLPVRTRLGAVTTTAGFEGVLLWRKADISNLEDTTWTTYNSSDSLDLSEPLHLRVYSASGNSSRTYTLKVNVHQQYGDSTTWDSLGVATAMEGLQARKMVVWNGELRVVGVAEDGTLTCLTHPLASQGEWTAQPTTGTEGADVATLQQRDGRLFVSTADGQVLESTDGVAWTPASCPAKTGLRLVAASADYLYGLADGTLCRSNGGAWQEETLDDEPSLLPTDQLNQVFYTMANGRPRLVLVGAGAEDDTTASIWAKSWEQGSEERATWVYYTPNQADKYRLPLLQNLCVVAYDNGLQALGGKSRDGRYAAMDSVFHSGDHGITWKTYENDDMDVDARLRRAAQSASYIVATVDENHFLWVLVDNQLWRGRINRLGFKRS